MEIDLQLKTVSSIEEIQPHSPVSDATSTTFHEVELLSSAEWIQPSTASYQFYVSGNLMVSLFLCWCMTGLRLKVFKRYIDVVLSDMV